MMDVELFSLILNVYRSYKSAEVVVCMDGEKITQGSDQSKLIDR